MGITSIIPGVGVHKHASMCSVWLHDGTYFVGNSTYKNAMSRKFLGGDAVQLTVDFSKRAVSFWRTGEFGGSQFVRTLFKALVAPHLSCQRALSEGSSFCSAPSISSSRSEWVKPTQVVSALLAPPSFLAKDPCRRVLPFFVASWRAFVCFGGGASANTIHIVQ